LKAVICEDPLRGPALLVSLGRHLGHEIFSPLRGRFTGLASSFLHLGDPLFAAYFRLRGHFAGHSLTEGGAARRQHQNQTDEERIGSPGATQLDCPMYGPSAKLVHGNKPRVNVRGEKKRPTGRSMQPIGGLLKAEDLSRKLSAAARGRLP